MANPNTVRKLRSLIREEVKRSLKESSDPQMRNVATAVASAMTGAFEYAIEDANDLADMLEDEDFDWIDNNLQDMYADSARPFRMAVLALVKRDLKL